jgi:hypothetical protein
VAAPWKLAISHLNCVTYRIVVGVEVANKGFLAMRLLCSLSTVGGISYTE